MSEKQQKQGVKRSKKDYENKQNRKNQKKSSNFNKISSQETQALHNKMMQQFLLNQLQKTSGKIQIEPLNEQIAQNIIKGLIKVSDDQKNIQSLIKSPQQQAIMKITPQQMEMYEKEAKRIEHLKLISNLNKQLSNKQPEEAISYILTKEEHERKVKDIIEEKKQREKRVQQAKLLLAQKIQKEQKQAEQRAKAQKIQEKERKRIEIQQKITKQKQQHIHFLSSDIKHRKDLEGILKKVPLHVKMQDSFKRSIQIPELEQKKQKLKQLREFRQKYDVQKIKQYQKVYLERHESRLQQSKFKRSSSLSRISQLNKNIPEKSQRLKAILAEQIQSFKRKFSQRELYVEEKLKREQNYLKKLREQYKPKIDKEKQEELIRKLQKQKEHLSKIGLNIDQKKVGLQYLSEVKKLAKKRKQQLQSITSEIMTVRSESRTQSSLPSLKRSLTQRTGLNLSQIPESLQKIRDKRLQEILNSQQSKSKKLQKLKIQTKKIQQAKQRKLGVLKHNFDEIVSKQASNLALNSLKAKINLIQLMKNK